MRAKLTRKQRLFIAEYQTNFNGTKAAIRAGYSEKNATEIAYQLLQKPPIQEAIERATAERLRILGVESERILTEIARVAFFDIRKIYNPDGILKLPHEWNDDTAAAISGLETLEEFQGRGEDRTLIGHTKKIKVFDKIKALEFLARYLGILGDGRRKDEEDEADSGRNLTTLELSAKIVYLIELAARRKKEQEVLSEKSQDEKPKELLKWKRRQDSLE